MGIDLEIFYLYKITEDNNQNEYLLIRCTRDEFPNHNQDKENQANKEAESKKGNLLNNYINQNFNTNRENVKIVFLGEMQVDTFGDELFGKGNKELTIYFAETSYGFPWLAIGQADSKQDFIQKMNDDEIYDTELGILSLNPKIETLKELRVTFITETEII